MHRPRSSPARHSARAGGEQLSEGAAFAGMRWGTAPLPGRGGPSPLLLHSSASGPRRQLLGAAAFPSAPFASAPPAASRRRQPSSASPVPAGARPLPAEEPAPAEGPARLFLGRRASRQHLAASPALADWEREREGRMEKREGRREGGKEGGSCVRGERLWLSAGRYRQRQLLPCCAAGGDGSGAAGAHRCRGAAAPGQGPQISPGK